MPTPNTDSTEVVANYIYTMLNNSTNKTALGVADVWYNDQTLLPHTPAVCVAPGDKRRQFSGATYRTQNVIETYVWVYYGKIQDIQANTHAATAMAEGIELLVHSDLKLGGNVIAVLCTQLQPGIAGKNGDLMVAVRMTFESMSKTTLPQQVV